MSQVTSEADLDPIFISVQQAARLLGLSTWSVYGLLDEKDEHGNPPIVSQYRGKRRLVRYDSVLAYADSLPTTRPESASGLS